MLDLVEATRRMDLSAMALSIASTSIMEPADGKVIERGPKDDPREVPPLTIEKNVFKPSGTTMQCPMEIYAKTGNACLDTCAMFSMVTKKVVPQSSMDRRMKVNYTVDGIGGEDHIEYVVPLRVKMGRGNNPGLWLWALVVDKLPFEACDVLLDNQTFMLLVRCINATSIDDIGLVTRSGEDMQKAIDRIAEEAPGMTPLVRRVYSLDQ